MQRRKRNWLFVALYAMAVCGGSTMAWSQEIAPVYASPNAGYAPALPVAMDDAPSLEDQVADLQAWKASMEAKIAADKKKAAGKPSVTVGGRIMADWSLYSQSAVSMATLGNQPNGFEFRRARIFVKGKAFNVVDYKVQYDFAGTQSTAASDTLQAPTFKDVWFRVSELPYLGSVKVGHFKEPFGLEELTSSKYISFMERSFTGAFTPARNVGVMAADHSDNENLTWAIGAFIPEATDEPPRAFDGDDGGTAVTTRVTFLPWYDEATEGRGLLHTGVAYSYRHISDESIRFRERPEAHLGDYIVSTGSIGAESYQLLGAEAAFVYGPFSIQSEYMQAFVNTAGGPDADFNAGYVYVSYFLTGENRRYKRSAGAFDRVKPFENFFRVTTEGGDVACGKGAWEMGYRISYIDLDDGAVTGGTATNHTVGLNWYLNPYTRLMWNYINSDASGYGPMDIFMMRGQIDF